MILLIQLECVLRPTVLSLLFVWSCFVLTYLAIPVPDPTHPVSTLRGTRVNFERTVKDLKQVWRELKDGRHRLSISLRKMPLATVRVRTRVGF